MKNCLEICILIQSFTGKEGYTYVVFKSMISFIINSSDVK